MMIGFVRFRADSEEKILEEVFGAKVVILLKHLDRIRGQDELRWGCEEWPVIYCGIGGGLLGRH